MQKAIRYLLLLITFLLSAGYGFTQTKPEEKLPVDPKVKIGKLKNGLTYYIRENKKPENKLELRLVINAGSILEDDDQQGLAHMAEHMAFNGTKHFEKNEIISYLQSIGVGFGNDLNAYTSFNETVYMLPIPVDKPGNLETGFQILEDWAHQVSYETADINEERNVILEESRLGQGAMERMRREFLPELLKDSRYAVRLPIGIDSIIENFKPDAIRRFYRDWYRPNLMAVIAIGDVDPAKLEALVIKHFEKLKNPVKERAREEATMPPYKSNNAMVVTDKEATSYSVSMYYSALPKVESTTLGGYRQDIVKSLFSTLINQRLRELTQQENPPYLGAGVGFGSIARGHDQLYVSIGTGENDPKKAMSAALEEIEKVKRFGFTATELEQVKKSNMAFIERQYNERDKSDSEDFTEEYIRHFLEGEAIPGIENEYRYYQQLMPLITLDELNILAKSFQQEGGNFFAMLLGPEADGKVSLPKADELISTALAVAAKKDVKPYEEKIIAESILAQKPQAGKVIKETKDELWGATVWELSNGIKVTVKKTDYKNDQILLGSRRAGGTSNYGVTDKLNAQYATAVADAMGIGEFSPTDLQKALSGKVASARVIMTGTTEGFSGSSNVKDLETMLQLLYLRATQPRVDTALFKSFMQRNKQQMSFAMANPQTAFIDSLFKVMYKDHPMAPIAVPRPEYFDQINMDRVLEIYKERFGDATGMQFVILGSIDEAILKPLVETYIGGLPVSGSTFGWKDLGVRTQTGKTDLNMYKGQAPQALILAMHSGEVPYSEDLDLKANAISEILNIRIIEELREKIQGIYSGGTSASVEKIPYESFQFFFQLPCGPEKVDTLLYAMNTEIDLLKKNGPSEKDLNKVKQQWIEAYKTGLQENATWLNRILRDRYPGAEADRFFNYEKYVNALTPEDIKQAANLLLKGDNVMTAILRPEEKK